MQNDTEEVRGLTPDVLDRMHHFTRLWRRTGWSPRELDLVLVTLGATALDAATLGRVVAFRQARNLLGGSLEETCALVGEIPRFAVAPDGTPLVEQLFNPPGSGATPLPDAARMFLHPSLRLPGSTTAPDPALPRLLAGLRVRDDDLLLLVTKQLRGALGVDPDSPDENARRFALGGKHLALLYRHARLAERLKLPIPQLFQLLELAGVSVVGGLDDLTALLDFHTWWRTSGYALDDLGLLLGKTVLDPTAYPKAPEVAAQVIADAAGALVFANTVFAVALGVSEDESRQILAANDASVVKLDEEGSKVGGSERYRLADDSTRRPSRNSWPFRSAETDS